MSRVSASEASRCRDQRSYLAACSAKQQRLYFFPLPQGQGSFLPVFAGAGEVITPSHYRAESRKARVDKPPLMLSSYPPDILSARDTLKIDAGRNKLNPLRMFLFLLYRSVEAVNKGQEEIGL